MYDEKESLDGRLRRIDSASDMHRFIHTCGKNDADGGGDGDGSEGGTGFGVGEDSHILL